ncbi:calcium-binding protein, partial [Pseudomonas sp. UMAB-40]|uniref:calcium-binding protein n=2 Tax=Pseudomonas sp. UMAB-40 TaxID=1365407 RepID=UPI0027D7FCD7
MNILNLSQAQLNTLADLQAQGDYPGAYGYLREIAVQQIAQEPNGANSIELGKISNWLSAAQSINKNDGTFYSNMVRGADRYAAGSHGRNLTDADFQIASDALANKVINDIRAQVGFPPLKEIIDADVQSAVSDLQLYRWQWAGTIGDMLPPPLGLGGDYVQVEGESFNDYMGNLLEVLLENAAGLMKFGLNERLDTAYEFMQQQFGTVTLGQHLTGAISDLVYQDFFSAVTFVDPLVLDLDGDGIETISRDKGVVFDHDGDGNKLGTGWLKGDDGFLVLDKNNNNIIDDGTELFGVNTLLRNGHTANNGFEALADLDSNSDGVFDQLDEKFSQVKIWQDRNQDGISQSSELKTLQNVGITSISVAAAPSGAPNNGNVISNVGSYTRNDVSTGAVSEGVVGSIDFAQNTFYREYGNPIELDADALTRPDMQGSGAVRDLREASMLSGALQQVLGSYSAAGSRQAQLDLMGHLLSAWAGTSDLKSFDESVAALSTPSYTVKFEYSWEGGAGSPSAQPTASQLELKSILEKVRILEAFTGVKYLAFSLTETGSGADKAVNVKSSFGASVGGHTVVIGSSSSSVIYVTEQDFLFQMRQVAQINKAYDALVSSVYSGLLFQTRFAEYASKIVLTIGNSGFVPDYSGVTNQLVVTHGVDAVKAVMDAVELSATIGKGQWAPYISSWIGELTDVEIGRIKAASGGSDSVILGSSLDSILSGTAFDDLIAGGSGNESLIGGEGNDFLYGGAGNDVIDGGSGNNQIFGEAGDDILKVSSISTGSFLAGGTGNDTLNGGYYSDTYLFNLGDGQDTIIEYDPGYGATDTLRFGAGILASDINMRRVDSDLVFMLSNGTDQVTVKGWFNRSTSSADAALSAVIERVEFADGTFWTWTDISTKGLNQVGTATSETLVGWSGNDNIHGGGGNDTLEGGTGTNQLYGDAGDDLIKVASDSTGNTLAGGTGNDSLNGGYYADTYLFNLGDGQDTITENDPGYGSTDTLRFGAGILASDINTRRVDS